MSIEAVVKKLVEGIEKPYKKAQVINNWLFNEFEWKATDYQERSVEEIIERKGGNCAEQTMVFAALLNAINIPSRWMLEGNSHPESIERQKNAEALMQSVGNRASLFGLVHNDHRFLEFFDEESKSWVPADPSFGVFGMEEWVVRRLGFSNEAIPKQENIIPLFVAVLDKEKRVLQIKNKDYLYDAFYQYSPASLKDLDIWFLHLDELKGFFLSAYHAEINMHHYTNKIKEAIRAYHDLRKKTLKIDNVIEKYPSL